LSEKAGDQLKKVIVAAQGAYSKAAATAWVEQCIAAAAEILVEDAVEGAAKGQQQEGGL